MSETPLTPSEFVAAVEDYADSIEDETYLKKCYAGQLVATDYEARTPLDAVDFSAAIQSYAGVEMDEIARERVEYAYLQQIETARSVGDGR